MKAVKGIESSSGKCDSGTGFARMAIWMKRALHLAAVSVFLCCFFYEVRRYNVQSPISGDAYGYITTAFNLYHAGVFSHACEDFSAPCPPELLVPTNYREPLPSTILALAFALYPGEIERSRLFPTPRNMDPEINAFLRNFNVGIRLIATLLAGAIAYAISKSYLVTYLSLLLVGTSPRATQSVPLFLSENLASLLLAATVLIAILAWQRRTVWMFAGSGLFLGLLALTKGIYYYGFLAVVGCALAAAIFQASQRKQILIGLALFSAAYAIPVGLWTLRNHLSFDSSSMASRGGIMLMIRAYYDRATPEETMGILWYYSPLAAWFKPTPEDYQRLNRLDRSNPEGFYQAAKAYAGELSNQHGPHIANKLLTSEAKAQILADPVQHLKVSLALLVNGLFVEKGKKVGDYVLIGEIESGLLLFASLLPLAAWGVIRKRIDIVILVAPALFSLIFNALISNSLPRYNQPLIPILWTSLTLCLYGFAVFLWAIMVRVLRTTTSAILLRSGVNGNSIAQR